MISPTRKFVIFFNGKIYNHLELMKKLDFKNFRGKSDTETITTCLEQWGILKTIESIDSMFVLNILNQDTKEITLIRDFVGLKPLFYGWNGKTLVGASQYDQIKNHPDFKKNTIDESVLKLYLQQHFMPAPFGLYKQTHQVKPAEMITFSLSGQITIKQNWEFPSSYEFSITDAKETQKLVSETLDKCVQSQLLSDFPLGSFLYGGVDSPLICSYSKQHNKNLSVISIDSDSKIHVESERARA
jgi:asparagine synthase (glutamine-hydrolysing)